VKQSADDPSYLISGDRDEFICSSVHLQCSEFVLEKETIEWAGLVGCRASGIMKGVRANGKYGGFKGN